MSSRDLRKPKSTISYKEPKESDIYSNIPGSNRRKAKPKDELFPIEIVEEDASRYKVHYVGFSSTHDEWDLVMAKNFVNHTFLCSLISSQWF